MNKNEGIVSSIIYIALGLMLIIMKGSVISLAITILGVAVLISAIMDLVNKLTNIGIVKAVIGVCILAFGWMFIDLALYSLAASIIVMGLLKISNIHKFSPVNLTAKDKIMLYMKPVVTVIAGACLFFNQGGTISWIFFVTGALLVIEGVMELVDSFGN